MFKQPLIFLHGALGNAEYWEPFLQPFRESFEIHNLNFPQHGKSRSKLAHYSLNSLTEFVQQYISKNGLVNCSIIGYSLGGYIALNLLAQKKIALHSILILATKLEWNVNIAAQECSKLNRENLEPILEKLQNETTTRIDNLIEITQSILTSIGEEPLSKKAFKTNAVPVFMLRGTKDRMVSEEEVINFANGTPCCQYIPLENQPHSIEKMDYKIISSACIQLLLE